MKSLLIFTGQGVRERFEKVFWTFICGDRERALHPLQMLRYSSSQSSCLEKYPSRQWGQASALLLLGTELRHATTTQACCVEARLKPQADVLIKLTKEVVQKDASDRS